MRIPTRPRAPGVSVNITPLIDVIFLLIIFFLAASHFGRTTAQNLPDLPESSHGKGITKNPLSIDVSVFADGALTLNEKPATLDEVRSALGNGFTQHGDKFEMYLSGDKDADYARVKPVLQAYQEEFLAILKQRQITGLNLTVLKK